MVSKDTDLVGKRVRFEWEDEELIEGDIVGLDSAVSHELNGIPFYLVRWKEHHGVTRREYVPKDNIKEVIL